MWPSPSGAPIIEVRTSCSYFPFSIDKLEIAIGDLGYELTLSRELEVEAFPGHHRLLAKHHAVEPSSRAMVSSWIRNGVRAEVVVATTFAGSKVPSASNLMLMWSTGDVLCCRIGEILQGPLGLHYITGQRRRATLSARATLSFAPEMKVMAL